jgi:hypothetical protein
MTKTFVAALVTAILLASPAAGQRFARGPHAAVFPRSGFVSRHDFDDRFRRFGFDDRFRRHDFDDRFRRFGFDDRFRHFGFDDRFRRFGFDSRRF